MLKATRGGPRNLRTSMQMYQQILTRKAGDDVEHIQ
jgi:hypothetical protein